VPQLSEAGVPLTQPSDPWRRHDRHRFCPQLVRRRHFVLAHTLDQRFGYTKRLCHHSRRLLRDPAASNSPVVVGQEDSGRDGGTIQEDGNATTRP
jgi:hypothetical protein